jgi:hypothetical protein
MSRKKFHEMGELNVGFMKLLFPLANSMYSKGNEQVLGKGTSLRKREKQKSLSCFVFVLILDVSRAARIYFVFSPGNEF